MLTREKYKMSFTSSSLRRRESAIIADLFLRLSDWDVVCNEVLSQNILQLNTVSSQKRIFSEIKLIVKSVKGKKFQLVDSETREEYEERIKSIYKQVADGCIEIQNKVGNYSNNRIKTYIEKESEIRKIIAEMPTAQKIKDMLAIIFY